MPYEPKTPTRMERECSMSSHATSMSMNANTPASCTSRTPLGLQICQYSVSNLQPTCPLLWGIPTFQRACRCSQLGMNRAKIEQAVPHCHRGKVHNAMFSPTSIKKQKHIINACNNAAAHREGTCRDRTPTSAPAARRSTRAPSSRRRRCPCRRGAPACTRPRRGTRTKNSSRHLQ